MENINIKNLIKTVPFFNAGNSGELHEKIKKTRDLLISRNYLDNHQFCRKKVSGLWLLKLSYEGAPQIIVRTEVPLGGFERLLLHGELFDLIGQDVVYDYQVDIVDGTSMIKGLKEELIKEIKAKRILTIYDNERDVIK